MAVVADLPSRLYRRRWLQWQNYPLAYITGSGYGCSGGSPTCWSISQAATALVDLPVDLHCRQQLQWWAYRLAYIVGSGCGSRGGGGGRPTHWPASQAVLAGLPAGLHHRRWQWAYLLAYIADGGRGGSGSGPTRWPTSQAGGHGGGAGGCPTSSHAMADLRVGLLIILSARYRCCRNECGSAAVS